MLSAASIQPNGTESMQPAKRKTTRIAKTADPARGSDRLPRKTPVQERGKLTFDAILDAAAQLLIERGYTRMTTNAVAERSGVSIGSLYQYFPNKQALVASLHERHVQRISTIMQQAFGESRCMTLRDSIAHNIRANFRAHQQERELHRALAMAAMQVPKLRGPMPRAQVMQSLLGLLQQHAVGVAAADRQAIAELIFETVESISHRAVVDHAFADERAAQTLLSGMITLLVESMCVLPGR